MHAFSMQNIAAMLCGIHLCALCLCLYLADHYLMLCDDVQYVQPLTDCLTPEALEECTLRWCNKPSEAVLVSSQL